MKTAVKDFKMTELGPIPKDWEVKRLGNIWRRFATGPFGSSLHASDYVSGGTPLVNPMHIVEGKIIPDKEMTVDCVTRKRLASYQLNTGDLVMGRRGEMGRVAVVTKKEQGWLCGTGSFAITLRDNESPDFVVRYLRTPQCVAEMTNEAVGTTIQNLNQTLVSQINIAYPPLPEQRKIAAALSDVDEMIAALEKLIEKKRKIKTGAMQRLLTGKTRLPGFKGAWVEKRLRDCAEVFCDGDWIESADQSDNGIRLVQTGNVGEGVFLDKAGKKRFVSEATFKRLNCCEIFAGDVLVSRLPDPAGRACLLPSSSERRITAVDCTVIRFNDLLAAEYFVAFSQTAGYYKQIDEQMAGSTRQRISRKALGDVVVACPPTLAEQKAIAKVLGDMDEEIATLEAELAKTRQLKQGMMQELLTGKTRLI